MACRGDGPKSATRVVKLDLYLAGSPWLSAIGSVALAVALGWSALGWLLLESPLAVSCERAAPRSDATCTIELGKALGATRSARVEG